MAVARAWAENKDKGEAGALKTVPLRLMCVVWMCGEDSPDQAAAAADVGNPRSNLL